MGNFMDEIRNEQRKYGGGVGDYFKFEKEGVYRMRILHQPKVIATHFFGKGNPAIVCRGIEEGCQYHGEDQARPSIKLATYILDRSDAKVKMAELPLSISYAMNDLQKDDEFKFEGFPMPYDVKITYDPNNSDPKAKYRMVAGRSQEKLSDEEEVALSEALKKQTPEQYVEKKKAGKKEVSQPKHEYPQEDINPDDIPF